MSISNRLREQIDACRAGRGDLNLPALAELAAALKQDQSLADELARSQRLDSKVRTTLDDVPVPADLAERIMRSLVTSAQPAADICLSPRLPESPQRGRWLAGRRIVTRRQWIVAGCSAALVGLIAFVSWQWLPAQPSVTQEEVAKVASESLAALGRSPSKAWQPIARLPKTIVIDRAIAGIPRQWQFIRPANSPGWAPGVTAIDLAPPGAPRAYLLVIKSPAKFSVPRPTVTARLSLSGGFTATAWQRQGSDLLFVLVVEEDRNQRLENYLRSAPAA